MAATSVRRVAAMACLLTRLGHQAFAPFVQLRFDERSAFPTLSRAEIIRMDVDMAGFRMMGGDSTVACDLLAEKNPAPRASSL